MMEAECSLIIKRPFLGLASVIITFSLLPTLREIGGNLGNIGGMLGERWGNKVGKMIKMKGNRWGKGARFFNFKNVCICTWEGLGVKLGVNWGKVYQSRRVWLIPMSHPEDLGGGQEGPYSLGEIGGNQREFG